MDAAAAAGRGVTVAGGATSFDDDEVDPRRSNDEPPVDEPEVRPDDAAEVGFERTGPSGWADARVAVFAGTAASRNARDELVRDMGEFELDAPGSTALLFLVADDDVGEA